MVAILTHLFCFTDHTQFRLVLLTYKERLKLIVPASRSELTSRQLQFGLDYILQEIDHLWLDLLQTAVNRSNDVVYVAMLVGALVVK